MTAKVTAKLAIEKIPPRNGERVPKTGRCTLVQLQRSVSQNRYIPSGTRVRLDSLDDNHLTTELGVVVHCWLDNEIGVFDCYVAFFGDTFPAGKPAEKPYLLRYAATSLTVLLE
jgi:hypothetical protein